MLLGDYVSSRACLDTLFKRYQLTFVIEVQHGSICFCCTFFWKETPGLLGKVSHPHPVPLPQFLGTTRAPLHGWGHVAQAQGGCKGRMLLSFLPPSAASSLQVGRAMAHLILKNISSSTQRKLQRRHSVLLPWWCLQQALNGNFGCFKLCVIFLRAQITRAEPTFNCSYVFN